MNNIAKSNNPSEILRLSDGLVNDFASRLNLQGDETENKGSTLNSRDCLSWQLQLHVLTNTFLFYFSSMSIAYSVGQKEDSIRQKPPTRDETKQPKTATVVSVSQKEDSNGKRPTRAETKQPFSSSAEGSLGGAWRFEDTVSSCADFPTIF